MSEVKLSSSAKILKVLAYVFMLLAMLLIALGFMGIMWGSIIPGVDPLYMLILGFLLLIPSTFLLFIAQQGIIKPVIETISLLKCTNSPNCKFTKGRKFEKDEYVFQELKEPCEKCNNHLYIAAIFDVEKKGPKPEKEKGKAPEETQSESWSLKDEKPKSE